MNLTARYVSTILFATSLVTAPVLTAQATDATLPANARTVYTTSARGVQIYRCTHQSDSYAWVFQSPEAALTDSTTHSETGKHGAGPTWTGKDGSSIQGKVIQKSDSPEPGSIPWLLLETKPTGAASGVLSTVTYVRRSDTHGGQPPNSGCDAQHTDEILRVRYSATYTFYTAAPATHQ